jgi:hypothetical protein
MKSCEVITFYELCSQGVELLSQRLSRASCAPQLPLTNSMPDGGTVNFMDQSLTYDNILRS